MQYLEYNSIFKIYNIHRTLYAVKYYNGGIWTESFHSKYLYNNDIKSVTVRGDKTLVSLLSDPTKNINIKSFDKLETTLSNSELKIKAISQLIMLKKLISNTSKPKNLDVFLSDLKYDELNLIIHCRYIKDYALGARINNKFDGQLVHYLLELDFLKYVPDKSMGLFSKKWTKEQQKTFNRHRIYSL